MLVWWFVSTPVIATVLSNGHVVLQSPSGDYSVFGCYTEHRPFGEPTKGSLGKATFNRNEMTNLTNRPFLV